jgi:hypothetical protein
LGGTADDRTQRTATRRDAGRRSDDRLRPPWPGDGRIRDRQRAFFLVVFGSADAASDCKSQAARFKGLADGAANAGKSANDWFNYDEGTKAGPTRSKPAGAGGGSNDYGCVMMLPIAVDNPAESGNSKQVYVVAFAAFSVTTVDSNTHDAKLLDDFITTGPGTDSWCRDCGGAVVIRLTW